MASSNKPDGAINEIYDFWFSLTSRDWFQDSAKHDAFITEHFARLSEQARTTDELDSWSDTPRGALALILLLDQFPRNMFRPGKHDDPSLSWSGDAKALDIAIKSIARGFDTQIHRETATSEWMGVGQRYFFYLPLMHAENLTAQVACSALVGRLHNELEISMMQKQISGEKETAQEKKVRDWFFLETGPFVIRHMDCIAKLGRFPARNEPLGRQNTAEEEAFLKEHPIGF